MGEVGERGTLSTERDLLFSFLRIDAAVAASSPVPPPVAEPLDSVSGPGAEGLRERLRRNEDERGRIVGVPVGVGVDGLVGVRSLPNRDFMACEKVEPTVDGGDEERLAVMMVGTGDRHLETEPEAGADSGSENEPVSIS